SYQPACAYSYGNYQKLRNPKVYATCGFTNAEKGGSFRNGGRKRERKHYCSKDSCKRARLFSTYIGLFLCADKSNGSRVENQRDLYSATHRKMVRKPDGQPAFCTFQLRRKTGRNRASRVDDGRSFRLMELQTFEME